MATDSYRHSVVRAGPVKATLDGVDIRRVRVGELEIIRRIHVAVRDTNWDNVPGEVTALEATIGVESFSVQFVMRHVRGPIDFAWHGTIVGRSDGTLSYRMSGTAAREFDYNRIGLCVLHPICGIAGAKFGALTPEGWISGVLPRQIGPQRYEASVYVPIVPACSELELEFTTGGKVGLSFEGDLFETEDQRNWTDASFKTFSTPMYLGFPHHAPAGASLEQKVAVTSDIPALPAARGRRPDLVAVDIREPSPWVMPRIGLGLGDPRPTTAAEAESLLRLLKPAHLRLDLDPTDPEWRPRLDAGLQRCLRIGAALELALFAEHGDDDAQAIASVGHRVARAGVTVARVLVFHRTARSAQTNEVTSRVLATMTRGALGLDCALGGGTDMNFSELNRTRPDVDALDVVSWGMTPQAHESDSTSLMETLEAQSHTVCTARTFAPHKPLAVGPITLRPRFNPVARGPVVPERGELPAHIDPRQNSQLCAAWTAGSVSALAHAGADALTYFETVGAAGVVEDDHAAIAAGPATRPSRAGLVFPVFHVLADLCAQAGERLSFCRSSAPRDVAAIASRRQVMLANLTDRGRTVRVRGFPWPDAVSLRRLSDATDATARCAPPAFRKHWDSADCAGRSLDLLLSPYEVATLRPPGE
jgi:hypothetical protein